MQTRADLFETLETDFRKQLAFARDLSEAVEDVMRRHAGVEDARTEQSATLEAVRALGVKAALDLARQRTPEQGTEKDAGPTVERGACDAAPIQCEELLGRYVAGFGTIAGAFCAAGNDVLEDVFSDDTSETGPETDDSAAAQVWGTDPQTASCGQRHAHLPALSNQPLLYQLALDASQMAVFRLKGVARPSARGETISLPEGLVLALRAGNAERDDAFELQLDEAGIDDHTAVALICSATEALLRGTLVPLTQHVADHIHRATTASKRDCVTALALMPWLLADAIVEDDEERTLLFDHLREVTSDANGKIPSAIDMLRGEAPVQRH